MAVRKSLNLEAITFKGAYEIEHYNGASWIWTGPTRHASLKIDERLGDVQSVELVVDNNLAPAVVNDVIVCVEQRRVKATISRQARQTRISFPVGGRSMAEDSFEVVLKVPVVTQPPKNDKRPGLGLCIHNVFLNMSDKAPEPPKAEVSETERAAE